jgi:hypothetical protein
MLCAHFARGRSNRDRAGDSDAVFAYTPRSPSAPHLEPMPMTVLRIAAALALLAAPAFAQEEPAQSSTHYLGIDSGLVANTNRALAAKGLPEVVWSTVVTVPGASWVRLHYAGVLLSGSRDRGGDGSFVRITSMRDGAFQTQHLVHVGQWQDTSAYFNGDSVLVELLAHPGTGDNRLMLQEATAGPLLPIHLDSICGSTDDRTLSNDMRVARNQPTGCTSWMINDCNHCFLTAGHCAGTGLQVVQFNVPLSTSSGALQHPPPQDQFAVDVASLQSNGGQGVGNDWAYFGVHPNSTTGLTPYQHNGGVAFDLAATPPGVAGQNIRITGNGSTSSPVSPTWYLVQKTHTGPYSAFFGTTVQYATDTTGGNSGSPVIVDGTNTAIGIHTHAGCTATGGANQGTGSNHAALQAALANPQGVCNCPDLAFTFPNGLPSFVVPTGGTIRFVVDGAVGLLAGSARFHYSTGGGFTTVVPTQVNATTFDATVPATLCGSTLTYYFSAEGQNLLTYRSPETAPVSTHAAPVASGLTTLRNYNFNTNPPGWSVVNTNLQTGAWVRGTPVDPRGPSADFDGSGQCWITGNVANEDVDGGPTDLITEIVDLSSATDPKISFAIWFTNDDNDDRLRVDLSNNGGATWTNVLDLGPFSGWQARQIRVRDVFPAPAQVRMRVSVADQPNNSVTEAAFDAFRIDDATCTPATFTTFGSGCTHAGSAPSLALVSLPSIGGTFALQVNGLTTAFPFMLVGLAGENTPLPLPAFAPGCTLLARPDVAELLTPSGSSAPWSLTIPNDPSLYGTLLFEQAIEFGPLWTMSHGGVGQIR